MPTSIPPFTNVPAPGDDVQSAWAQQLTHYAVDHVTDTDDAHDASAISFVPTGTIAATNVQAAIAEVASEAGTGVSDHLADADDAHDASAISFVPTGSIGSTNVQSAIAEVAAEAAAGATTIPPGTVNQTVAAVAPSGWLMMDGSTVTNGQSIYPALWAVIPASMKSGANIVMPDARGRTLIGAGTGSGLTARTLMSTVGNETHALALGELAGHQHTGPSHAHAIDHDHLQVPVTVLGSPIYFDPVGTTTPGTDYVLGSDPSGGLALLTDVPPFTGNSGPAGTGVGGPAGSGTAHNNMQPSLALNMIMKV